FEVEVTRVGLVYRRPRAASAWAVTKTVTPAPRPPPADVIQPVAGRAGPPPRDASPPPDLAPLAFDRVMALANTDGAESAEWIARGELRRHALSAPLHYLHAAL